MSRKMEFTPKVWSTAGIVAAASLASVAQAGAIMSYNPSISATQVTSDAAIGGKSSGNVSATQTTLNVEQFNSSLGTLQSIELAFTENVLSFDEGMATGYLASCTEESGNGCTYYVAVGFGVTGTMTTPDGPEDLATADGDGYEQDVGPFLNLAQGTSHFFNYELILQDYGSSPRSLGLGGSGFIPYVGAGDWQANFDLLVSNINFFQQCQASSGSYCGTQPNPGGVFDPAEFVRWELSGLQVKYTYEAAPAPEPGTLFLFGAGVAGLLSARRKTRSSG